MTWDELRQEAFGEMDMNPTEFYDMEREDYWLKHRGFFNKRVYEQRVLRRMVMTIIAPHVKNLPSPFSVLPLPNDDELKAQMKEQSEVSKERALLLLDRINKAKETGKRSGVTIQEKLEMMKVFKENSRD